jgi:4,5-dihydroxyphthalate decarboxylase
VTGCSGPSPEPRTSGSSALDPGAANSASDHKYGKLRKIVGHDPLPYGTAANLKTIEALAATAFKQKLTPRAMQVEELFVNPEKT